MSGRREPPVSRRTFCAALMLAWPAAASAQRSAPPGEKPRRVGFILNSFPQATIDRDGLSRSGFGVIESRLRELGWGPGALDVKALSAESRYERFPAIVDELVSRRVEVIVVGGPEAARVARERAPSIPLVEAMAFNRAPGNSSGNVTGPVVANPVGKRLELLKAIAPGSRRIAMFARVAPGEKPPELSPSLLAAASRMGWDAFAVYFDAPEELDARFAEVRRRGADAVYMSSFPLLTWDSGVRNHVLGLVSRHRLPAVYEDPDLAAEGGLVAFGADDREVWRRAAYYVDRILRGARAADVPREEPTRFLLHLNRRTALSLGLTLPSAIALQADRVFE